MKNLTKIIEVVLAYVNAHATKNVRMTERHLADLRSLCKPLVELEPTTVEPVGLVSGALGESTGYDIAVTDDDGRITFRLQESTERDAAAPLTWSQAAQMRRDLLRVMLKLP